MPHTIVDPGSPPDQSEALVELLSPQLFPGGGGGEDWSVLAAYPLVRGHQGGFVRNTRGYQVPESDVQRDAGDGRPVLGERTLDLLVTGASVQAAQAALTELYEHLELATALRYAGLVQRVATFRGLTSVQPLAGGRTLRVTLAYAPAQQFAEDASEQPVLGVV